MDQVERRGVLNQAVLSKRARVYSLRLGGRGQRKWVWLHKIFAHNIICEHNIESSSTKFWLRACGTLAIPQSTRYDIQLVYVDIDICKKKIIPPRPGIEPGSSA